jgi:hypothetical protein
MRATLLTLLLATALVARDKNHAAPIEPMMVRVHGAVSAKPATMHITMSGGLFQSLGIDLPSSGSLKLEGVSGTATGSIKGELTEAPGEMTFTSDEAGVYLEISVAPRSSVTTPVLHASGRVVSVIRRSDGVLRVESKP